MNLDEAITRIKELEALNHQLNSRIYYLEEIYSHLKTEYEILETASNIAQSIADYCRENHSTPDDSPYKGKLEFHMGDNLKPLEIHFEGKKINVDKVELLLNNAKEEN